MKFDLKYGEKIFLHKISLFSFIIIVILHIIVAKNLFVKSNYLLIDISQPTHCTVCGETKPHLPRWIRDYSLPNPDLSGPREELLSQQNVSLFQRELLSPLAPQYWGLGRNFFPAVSQIHPNPPFLEITPTSLWKRGVFSVPI